jgi:aminoglycoside phosphotransferase (APT) family kinase protein
VAIPAVKESGFEVACHNDWAPTNTVFRDGEPIGMIDFDTAAPGERLWDLGYSVFTWLDLGNDELSAAEQIRRLHLFAQAYNHSECTTARVAVYAVSRQTALAASSRAGGKPHIADWAFQCASWTVLNILEKLLPSR